MTRGRLQRWMDWLLPNATISIPMHGGRSVCLYRKFAYQYSSDIEAFTAIQLLDLVPTTGCFWDIGAHVGYWSLFMALNAPREIAIEAFEPNPVTFPWLERHFQINELGARVGRHNLAFSDHVGEAVLRFNDTATSSTLIQAAAGALKLGKCISVPVSTVDALLQTSPFPRVPSLIKIDCEGHELRVLKGASTTLKLYHPRIILEIHPWQMGLIGDSPENITGFLESHGYDGRIIDAQESGIFTLYAEPRA